MRHVAIGGAILFALAILIGAFPVAAAPACGPWEKVLDNLYKTYGELPSFIATEPGTGGVPLFRGGP